jgi:hypothetical protein
MEVISIDGVAYTKVSTVAKQFKYTADYVGQLCRANKVDAKLVGRTWYVNPLSLTTHKKSKKNKSTPAESVEEEPSKIKISRIDVEPVLRSQAAKVINEPRTTNHFSKRIDWKPLRYEVDQSDLLPELHTMSKNVVVDLAESVDLPVNETTKPTKMTAEALPTVSLKGKLKVHSIEDDFQSSEENIAISDEISEDAKPILVKESEEARIVPIRKKLPVDKKTKPEKAPTPEIAESKATYEVVINREAIDDTETPNFTPKLVSAHHRLAQVVSGANSSTNTTSSTSIFWSLLGLLFAVLILSSVIILDVTVSASPQVSETSLSWSLPS